MKYSTCQLKLSCVNATKSWKIQLQSCKTVRGCSIHGIGQSLTSTEMIWSAKCELLISNKTHFIRITFFCRLKFILLGIDRTTISVRSMHNLKTMVQRVESDTFTLADSHVSIYYNVLRSVDLCIKGCVKSRSFLLRRDASSAQPSARACARDHALLYP